MEQAQNTQELEAEAEVSERKPFDAGSLCGIPQDHLDQFGIGLEETKRKQWSAIRKQLNSFQWRIGRENDTLRKQLERSKRASVPGRDDAERWERLRERLEEIESSEDTDEGKKARIARVMVGAVDRVEFVRSLERGIVTDNADARKLYAQLAGLLEERPPGQFAPVFNFHIRRVDPEETIEGESILLDPERAIGD